MDVELIKTLTKYPIIVENNLVDSIELKQNKTCVEKCKEKDCLNLFNSLDNHTKYICSKGYDNLLHIVGDVKFITNGLIYKTNKIIPQGRKDVRKEWIVDENSVLIFSKKIQEIENNLLKRNNETMEKNFSMFHDFKTSMSIFFNCTQDIINKLPGNTFIEKLENSDVSYKDLYNSLELITSQLRMVDVIINPKSIIYGRKKSINIFQLFEKIIILFGHLSTKKKGINIKLIKDGWFGSFECFESIEFIPLILIDNALKYSVPNSDVEIKFEQHKGIMKVIVKNIGPIVADENKDKIFEKFFRDESGQKFSKEGIGMGLWIAKEILKAHNCDLNYHKDPKETKNIGLNIFEFELPIS